MDWRSDAGRLVDLVPELQDIGLTPEKLRAEPELLGKVRSQVDLQHRLLQALSRTDPNVFASYVFQHRQHRFHRLLQDLYTKHPLLCVDAPIEHGKTTQTSVVRMCWELGRRPAHLAGIFSNSKRLPELVLRQIRRTIEYNERFRAVFPDCRIERALTNELWLERPGTTSKDPSLIAMGVEGAIIGSRLSLIVLDDMQDFDNTWTEHERRKLWELLMSTIVNRLLDGGSLWDIGTPWHIEDARHKLRRLEGYSYAHFDATDGLYYRLNGQMLPIPGGVKEGLWPEPWHDPATKHTFGWPPERLARKRRTMPALEFDRQFRCIASAGSLRIFNPEDIQRALQHGRGLDLPSHPRMGEIVMTGVDLAVGRDSYADETVMFTGTVRDYSSVPRYTPLDIRHGRWELTAIVENFGQIVDQFPTHNGFLVENNAAQDYLYQLVSDAQTLAKWGWSQTRIGRMRVRPLTTTAENKWHAVLGVKGMAMDFEQDRWVFPCTLDGQPHEAIQRVIDGLLGFDPTGHTSDFTMAQWIFVDAARRYFGSVDDMWTRVGLA